MKTSETTQIDGAIILGSGLSCCFDERELEPVGSIEGTSVDGHDGALALWRSEWGVQLVARGRRHFYEGATVDEVTRTVGIAAARGARRLIVTNAAGGLRTWFRTGDIMLISGLNALLLGRWLPLLHARDPVVSIERSATRQFDRERLDAVIDRALERGVRLQHGVYAGVLGPAYETRAEIRMLRAMGADAVGMSTVAEFAEAARYGIDVTGLSLITNTLSDVARWSLDHDTVIDVGARSCRNMRSAIEAALAVT